MKYQGVECKEVAVPVFENCPNGSPNRNMANGIMEHECKEGGSDDGEQGGSGDGDKGDSGDDHGDGGDGDQGGKPPCVRIPQSVFDRVQAKGYTVRTCEEARRQRRLQGLNPGPPCAKAKTLLQKKL